MTLPAIRSEELFVGLVALGLIPLITMRILRGLRDGRLPVYRAYLSRDEAGAGRFNALLAAHVLSLLLAAVIAADLLLGLGLRERL